MICYVDGGYDNVNKRNPYFSYKVYTDDHQLLAWVQREVSSSKTSNEAEYNGLIHLLVKLSRINCKEHVIIYSDSQLLVNQMKGHWKVKSKNLLDLWNIANSIIDVEYDLVWLPRKEIVKELGH